MQGLIRKPGPRGMVACRCGYATCGKALPFNQHLGRHANATNRIGQEALSPLVVVILGRMYILKLRLETLLLSVAVLLSVDVPVYRPLRLMAN